MLADMRRRLFTMTTAASLALCVGVVALWARSWRVQDWVRIEWVHGEPPAFRSSPDVMFRSIQGRFRVAVSGQDTVGPTGCRWQWLTRVPDRPSSEWDRFFWEARRLPAGSGDGPYWGVHAGVPHGLIVGGLAVLPAVWMTRRFGRRPPHGCPQCGYDLRATPSRCPECGEVTAVEPPATMRA